MSTRLSPDFLREVPFIQLESHVRGDRAPRDNRPRGLRPHAVLCGGGLVVFMTAADAHELVGLRATGPHIGEVLIQPDPLTVRVTAGQPRREVMNRNIRSPVRVQRASMRSKVVLRTRTRIGGVQHP